MAQTSAGNLIEYFSSFVSQERLKRMEAVLNNRTRYLTVVLENIYHSQNASAVVRSCDAFGIQDVHIIEKESKFKMHRKITMGSGRWITLKKYNRKKETAQDTLKMLKIAGYRIVATSPHSEDKTISDFDILKGKTALVFGSELKGLSQAALEYADEYVKIPMYGFVESFNISVCCGIMLHQLSERLRSSTLDWSLSAEEKDEIKLTWLKNTIKHSAMLEKEFYRSQKA